MSQFPSLWLVLTMLPSLLSEPIPRITFSYGDPRRAISTFRLDNVMNYDQLLPSHDGKYLYVGARDYILSFHTDQMGILQPGNQIPWPPSENQIGSCIMKAKSKETECFNFIRVLVQMNSSHLYTCGTNAFSPICTTVDLDTFSMPKKADGEVLVTDGKGQSPFDPKHKHTAVLVDGELYTGTMYNFQGNEPIIVRNLGSRPGLKTDASLGWLHSDASFVGSYDTQGPPADRKVYFFFEETARESDFFEKLKVSRVARVCKNDIGGEKVLQKKWTTFLKAQLLCSNPDYFPFNVMHHVALLHPEDPTHSMFYGVFSSQWQGRGFSSSAVCAYKLTDIEKVFNGNYKEQNKESSRWTTYTGTVSSPRPGSCSVGSSSDKDLTFMKDHFLMDQKVTSVGGHPLLIKENVQYTRIAIATTQAVSRLNYTVMFLGTDRGAIHKAVIVNNSSKSHIIEELVLTPNSEPIQSLLLAPNKEILYVGSSTGIHQFPLANCSTYSNCFDCILARDPYCAWDVKNQQCQRVHLENNDSHDHWLQDIETGNLNTTCLKRKLSGRTGGPTQDLDTVSVKAINYTVPYNRILKLHCPQLSALANYSWSYPNMIASEKHLVISKDTLVLVVRGVTLGLYECFAVENGFRYKVARYWVKDPSGVDVSHTDYTNNGDESNKALDGENGQMFPFSNTENYYAQFVVVTVLLSLTLCGILVLALYTWRDKIKAKSKIQGCSTPENEKLANKERTPLNGTYANIGNLTGQCCGNISKPEDKRDLDNNSMNLMTPNGGASADPGQENV
ncbi:semaphorin-4A [Bombina bombina]|uniref:semaphorin-4A n=1 Tax=Bombina bombina TaxID=8345 RepID=UPI00235ABEFC|nr:semaphorin-4A [Bombina bombina]XP_053560445.1 semaphorin-4A [Bombina bombina]XP_053560446.1 semaphorin-4A [Bombina bombina]